MTSNNSDADIPDASIDYKKHWNSVYSKNPSERLGWFEKKSTQTLDLINQTNLVKTAKILNIGAGSSVLIDNLLELGFTNIIANDLSEVSLASLKKRVGMNEKVQFIVDDLLHPLQLNSLKNVDLWNDRAVLHFFVKKHDISAYFNLLKRVLSQNGYVIIAVFAKNGADKCSELPLQKYDVNMLQKELGPKFTLLKTFNYTYINPYGGERPYIYTLFQRIQ